MLKINAKILITVFDNLTPLSFKISSFFAIFLSKKLRKTNRLLQFSNLIQFP